MKVISVSCIITNLFFFLSFFFLVYPLHCASVDMELDLDEPCILVPMLTTVPSKRDQDAASEGHC